LFADLTIVLMLVFATSRVTQEIPPPTTVPTTTTTTTTTTTVPSVTESGVRLQAIEFDLAIGDPLAPNIAERLERRLLAYQRNRMASVPHRFGVILIFAGARTDGDTEAAKKRACEIADVIKREWARVKPDAVYFKCFHDLSLFKPYARISLFPFID
jgi:hypothetical protein